MGRSSCIILCLVVALQFATSLARVAQRDRAFIGWSGESYRPEGVKENGILVETLSWAPRAFVLHNLLSDEECDHLVDLAKTHMAKSMVVDSATGKPVASSVRTSSGYFLQRGHDAVVKRIEQRLADITRLPVENGESLHVLHYAKDEKYEGHFDYFHDSVNTQNGGQRLATVLMYLTDVDEGGETLFPSAPMRSDGSQEHMSLCGKRGLAYKPQKGSALLFYSLKPDGSMDSSSLHSSCPVVGGNKWSATKWIRQRAYKI